MQHCSSFVVRCSHVGARFNQTTNRVGAALLHRQLQRRCTNIVSRFRLGPSGDQLVGDEQVRRARRNAMMQRCPSFVAAAIHLSTTAQQHPDGDVTVGHRGRHQQGLPGFRFAHVSRHSFVQPLHHPTVIAVAGTGVGWPEHFVRVLPTVLGCPGMILVLWVVASFTSFTSFASFASFDTFDTFDTFDSLSSLSSFSSFDSLCSLCPRCTVHTTAHPTTGGRFQQHFRFFSTLQHLLLFRMVLGFSFFRTHPGRCSQQTLRFGLFRRQP